VINEFVGSVL